MSAILDKPYFTIADMVALWVSKETWRTVVGFSDYEVSSFGNVRRRGSPRNLETAESHGYPFVSMMRYAEPFNVRVHVAVVEAFLGEPPFEGSEVAHNDGVRNNCRIDNLRWATKVENQADRSRHGTRIQGSEVFGAKLDEAHIPIIRQRIAKGEVYRDIANDYDVSISTISLIKRDRIWRHTQ